MNEVVKFKVCSKCEKIKPKSEFEEKSLWCKPCNKERLEKKQLDRMGKAFDDYVKRQTEKKQ